jgi:hypothetical protein
MEAAQVDVAEMSGLDLHTDHSLAMTVSGHRIEIAGATVGAVAVL